jgi:D-sedoheptulose 7-phosphate isomerase
VNVLVTTLEARIAGEFDESIRVKQRLIKEQVATLSTIAEMMLDALRNGKKIILFGNGGSAADSQHIAAELVSRFRREREAMPAIALTTDTSILTSIGNDYGFEKVFSRQIEAMGNDGDIAVGISTSGNSPNVLKALETAKLLGMHTIGFTGDSGGKLKDFVDICFHVPSNDTARIQESHITAAHALCNVIEEEMSLREV